MKGYGFGIIGLFFSGLEVLGNDGWYDGDFVLREPWSFVQNGSFRRFGYGHKVIDATQRPMDPNFAHQPTLDSPVIVQKADVVDGQDQFRAIAPPFWPSQCGEVDVTGDVEEVCLNGCCFTNNSQSIQKPFAEFAGFSPIGLLLCARPCSPDFCKGLLDAEISKVAFFAKEPGDIHEVWNQFSACTMTCVHALAKLSNPECEK